MSGFQSQNLKVAQSWGWWCTMRGLQEHVQLQLSEDLAYAVFPLKNGEDLMTYACTSCSRDFPAPATNTSLDNAVQVPVYHFFISVPGSFKNCRGQAGFFGLEFSFYPGLQDKSFIQTCRPKKALCLLTSPFGVYMLSVPMHLFPDRLFSLCPD